LQQVDARQVSTGSRKARTNRVGDIIFHREQDYVAGITTTVTIGPRSTDRDAGGMIE